MILTIQRSEHQINKILTSLFFGVKLMLKKTGIVEKYCNICVAFYGHLLTKIFNVKLNT